MTSESRRPSLPKFAPFGGLALAVVSASCLTGVAATAHAAPSTPTTPVNGPISYTKTGPHGFETEWHDINPDGTGDALVPVSDQGLYNGAGPGTNPGVANPEVFGGIFSPDGTRVVFQAFNGCRYLADANGSNAVALTVVAPPYVACTTLAYGRLFPTASPLPVGSFVGWSADSAYLYFADAAGNINTLTANGATAGALATKVPAGYRLLSVSPTGALALAATTGSQHIGILDPGAATVRDIGTGSDASFSAANGQLLVLDQVVIPGQSTGGFVLFLVDAANGIRTQITDPAVDHVSAGMRTFTWSPDGKQVAYTSGSAIYTRPVVAGGARTLVVQGTASMGVASWHNGPIAPAPAADRLAGADRIDTAVHVSQWSYDSHGVGGRQAKVAVLSRSDQFADALGGSALAAQKGGPLLLTPTAALDDRAKTELTRVLTPGATVYVLGGTSALSPAVEQSIRDLGFVPQRLQGPDRFSTATTIASAVSAHPHTVMVATGRNFPDALAAGAAAAQDPNGGVVILSDDAALPAPVKTYLSGIDPTTTNVYAVGGQGKAALATSFPAWHPTPLAGNDRYETAALVAKSALFPGPIGSIGLATGSAWPDALSGGALIATQHGPLLLTPPVGTSDQLPAIERDLVVALAPHLSNIVVFGGQNAVSGGLELNTATAALGANHFFTYVNRLSPTVAGAR
jgi:hypothetical protein